MAHHTWFPFTCLNDTVNCSHTGTCKHCQGVGLENHALGSISRNHRQSVIHQCPPAGYKILHNSWRAVCTLCICGASWLSGSVRDVQPRDCGFHPRLHWICSDIVLLGKALCSHMHSLDPGESGYLVGQWRLVCLNSSMHQKWPPGCMLPRELRWLMNKQVLWPGGNCMKSGEWCCALIPDYNPRGETVHRYIGASRYFVYDTIHWYKYENIDTKRYDCAMKDTRATWRVPRKVVNAMPASLLQHTRYAAEQHSWISVIFTI